MSFETVELQINYKRIQVSQSQPSPAWVRLTIGDTIMTFKPEDFLVFAEFVMSVAKHKVVLEN